jgi:hypothetical protein
MSNLKLLKILNPILVTAFLAAALAIVFLKYIHLAFLPGNVIYTIHILAGKIFIVLAICHIILNWKWIKLNILGIKPKSKAAKSSKSTKRKK